MSRGTTSIGPEQRLSIVRNPELRRAIGFGAGGWANRNTVRSVQRERLQTTLATFPDSAANWTGTPDLAQRR